MSHHTNAKNAYAGVQNITHALCECIVSLSCIFFLSLLLSLSLFHTMSSNFSVIFYVCVYVVCLCVCELNCLADFACRLTRKASQPHTTNTPCQKISRNMYINTHISVCMWERIHLKLFYRESCELSKKNI